MARTQGAIGNITPGYRKGMNGEDILIICGNVSSAPKYFYVFVDIEPCFGLLHSKCQHLPFYNERGICLSNDTSQSHRYRVCDKRHSFVCDLITGNSFVEKHREAEA